MEMSTHLHSVIMQYGNLFYFVGFWQILACLMCPLLIPVLGTVKKDGSSMYFHDVHQQNAVQVRNHFQNIIDFYRAPKVKYSLHLVYIIFHSHSCNVCQLDTYVHIYIYTNLYSAKIVKTNLRH